MNGLMRENQKLVDQLLEFSDEMEKRLEFLKKKDKLNESTVSQKSNKELSSKLKRLNTEAQKVKYIKAETAEMYKVLENSYNVEGLTKMENELKDKERILEEQKAKLKDLRKVKRTQQRFIDDTLNTEANKDKVQAISDNMHDAKDKLKVMQNNYREEDKRLRDEHEELTIMEEKSRKLKELITERKKDPNGGKKLSEEDVQEVYE